MKVEELSFDMPEAQRAEVGGIIKDAYRKHTPYGQASGQRDMAKLIKETLDDKYGGAWHVIVGSNFGSFVTHEMGSLLFASIGATNVFIYQHG